MARTSADRALITAVVGGGRGCKAVLQMVEEDTLAGFRMSIAGVADINPDAAGIHYAREIGVQWITTDYRDLYAIPNLDLILELTGSDRVRDGIERTRPRHVRLIDCFGAKLFWELHQAEAELFHTRDYLQSILDNAPVMVITTDLEGRIVSFNRHAELCYGHTANEVIGKPVTMLFGTPQEWGPLLRRVQQGGTLQDHQTTRGRKDGSHMIVSVTLAQLRDKAGNMIGMVAMSRDISQQQALMNQVIQGERLAAVGRLAAGVAHELNNPMAVMAEITGYLTDLIEEGSEVSRADLDAELKEGLPKVAAQIQRCRGITSRLLGFARKSEVRMQVADVATSVDEILPFLEKEAQRAGVQIQRRLTADMPKVAIEDLQLEEVLINLINNAIDAMRPRGHGNIWLFSEHKDDKVILTVKDDGPGIAQDVMERLFDPFVTTKPVGQGTGLGLSICYGIIKQHGGKILVDSEPDKGAAFRIILPAYDANPAGSYNKG